MIMIKRKEISPRLYQNNFIKYKDIFIMSIPMVAYFILFYYMPMYGVVISFKDFNPSRGILGSDWVGLKHFKAFFNSHYFGRLIRNTLLLSVYSLLWGFPTPIVFALLLNEISNRHYKKAVQSITYMPHFISMVVVCGLIKDFTASEGVINDIIAFFGGARSSLLINKKLFRTIYIASGVWQDLGFNSIIYLAAISGISQELYEAAIIDGANRWKQTIHVTLPSIAPTIVILFIMQIGGLMNVGFEKVLLLYNNSILQTADVISTFVYRKGLLEFSYSYSAAVGLFNSVINCILLVLANFASRKLTETSLW
ncbi:MAG TPA: sugar ABC transporter permease [Clostridiales bacterium]|nr:sugar ABC transporter permease [Clostridiales bacterium]